MTVRFMGKNNHKKVVIPMKNSSKARSLIAKASIMETEKQNEDAGTTISDVEIVTQEETSKKKENKKQKKSKEMLDENKLAQMEAIADEKVPQQKVKVEKADKGLYERTENSTILLTEDNKMLLND